ncbi:MAG: transposase [Planctomycetaceae bacterium]
MGRPLRAAVGGMVYHVLNRANARMPIFEEEGDYLAFFRILAEARERVDMRVLAWCVMRNHWHLVLWPRQDGDLSEFTGWLTLTHTQRWHAHRGSAGSGHLYQGRFKSFPIQEDNHFLTVCRYVERNALRSNLVTQAEAWPWGSLHAYTQKGPRADLLTAWPIRRSSNWVQHVNAPQTEAEVAAIRKAIQRGCPYGDGHWTQQTAAELQLESTLIPRGRPKKSRPAGQ